MTLLLWVVLRGAAFAGLLSLQPNRQVGEVPHTVFHDPIVDKPVASFVRVGAEVVIFTVVLDKNNPFTCNLTSRVSPAPHHSELGRNENRYRRCGSPERR
jgi:hypothetical protein